MTDLFPEYLSVSREELGRGQPVGVRIVGDAQSLAKDFAETILAEIASARQAGRRPTLIVPVGPVDQFPILAEMVNQRRESLADVVFINMDEYLTDDDRWLPIDHPLSFRGYMNRRFYDLLDPALAPPPEQRVFPDPTDPAAIERLIQQRGGVDVCFGGIGINGHIAFNEPPEPNEQTNDEAFVAQGTRILSLARETRTINAVTVGGEISVIPRRCMTVGMREILAARKLRFYCNRPWQSGVIRRVLHGPISAACPASFLRTHADAVVSLTDFVAEPPQIALR